MQKNWKFKVFLLAFALLPYLTSIQIASTFQIYYYPLIMSFILLHLLITNIYKIMKIPSTAYKLTILVFLLEILLIIVIILQLIPLFDTLREKIITNSTLIRTNSLLLTITAIITGTGMTKIYSNNKKTLNLQSADIIAMIEDDASFQDEIYYSSFLNITYYEPYLNAMVTGISKEDILLLEQLSKKRLKLPLKGLAVLIKDAIDTQDYVTTGGLIEFKDHQPTQDAEVVKNIKNAGGVIIGKTNLPAGSMDFQTFNDIFGRTNNPYDLSKTPGGSSGGSAAAIAAGYALMAVGTDLAGSLRQPAAFCGITSLKPTIHKISIQRLFPPITMKNYQVTVGPMAYNIQLLSQLYQSMLGQIPEPIPKIPPEDITIMFSIGLSDFILGKKERKELEKVIKILEVQKFNIKEELLTLDLPRLRDTHNGLFQLFFNNKLKHDEKTILQWQGDFKRQVDLSLEDVDVIILPTTPMVAPDHNPEHHDIPIDDVKINYWLAMGQYCMPFSVTGHPVITLPVGKVGKLPLGVQIVGKHHEEMKLLSIAKSIEDNIPINYTLDLPSGT